MKLSEKVLYRELDDGSLKIGRSLNDYLPETVRVDYCPEPIYDTARSRYGVYEVAVFSVSVAGITCVTTRHEINKFSVKFKDTVSEDDQHEIINILKAAYSLYQDAMRNKDLKKTEAISTALRNITGKAR